MLKGCIWLKLAELIQNGKFWIYRRKKIEKKIHQSLLLSLSTAPSIQGQETKWNKMFSGRSVGGHREWQLLSHRGRRCLPYQPLTLAPRWTSLCFNPTNPHKPNDHTEVMIFKINFVKLKIHPMRWLWLKSSRDSWTNLPIWIGIPLLN